MKNKTFYFYLMFLIPYLYTVQISAQNWNLVWSDEFTNDIGPDWVFDIGDGTDQGIPGWGNNELQYYRAENATIANGQLILTAKNEPFGGKDYTSARLKTQDLQSFRYGRIEASIALPGFVGSWPAFWALGTNINEVGWPFCGEIDIMEHANDETTIHGTIHWSYFTGQGSSQWLYYSQTTNITNVTDFHTYAVEWDAQYIRWYIDDVMFNEALITNGINGTSEFHGEFYLLLNLAIGGSFTGNQGIQVPQNEADAQLKIDWIRVYEKSEPDPIPEVRRYEAEDYAFMNSIAVETSTDPAGDTSQGTFDPPLIVTDTDAGDWLAYQHIDFPYTGEYTFRYRVASDQNNGVLSADLNAGATQLGQIPIPNTGSLSTWSTISQTVTINEGIHSVGIAVNQGGWYINWFEVVADNEVLATAEFQKEAISIYPNPVQDYLRIAMNASGTEKYEILNMIGVPVKNGVLYNQQIAVSNLPIGIYFLKIENYPAYKFVKK